MVNKPGWRHYLNHIRYSNGYATFIVFATLFVDSMLLLAPAPILPVYLYEEKLKKPPVNRYNATNFSTNSSFSPTTTETTINQSSFTVACQENARQKSIEDESLAIGILLASKPAVQTFTNLAAGSLSDHIGHDIPMSIGYILLCSSSLVFAFGKSYVVLLLARMIQGVGSSGASVVGLAMLAKRFDDDEERGRRLGFVFGGFGAGYLIGPSFASVTYQYAGKEAPFLILAGISIFVGVLQLCSANFKPTPTFKEEKKSSILELLQDPYIFLASTTLMFSNLGLATLETGLPIWMVSTMCASKWMLGVASLPISVMYLVFTFALPRFVTKDKRWLFSLVATYISVIGYVAMPFCKNLTEVIGPGAIVGMSVGLVDIAIIPMMGTLADTRHGSLYGGTYAIADSSFCVAAIAGPLLAGAVIRSIGFEWLMFILATLYFGFAPLMFFLRNPPPISEETMPIVGNREAEKSINHRILPQTN